MIPAAVSSRSAGGTVPSRSRCSPCVRARRMLVSSLPPSPITAVACPAMLLFVVAFYALHALMLTLISRASGADWKHTRSTCADVLAYASHIGVLASALAVTHLSRVLPNMLYKSRWLRAPAAPTDEHAVRTGSTSRALARVVWLLLEVAQRAVWILLLVQQLRTNWRGFALVDAILERHKLSTESSALDQPDLQASGASALKALALTADDDGASLLSASSSMCGGGVSRHLIRWSLVCIVVTSALAVSLLLVVAEEGFIATRRRLREARTATLAARRLKGSRADAWRACCATCCAIGGGASVSDAKLLSRAAVSSASKPQRFLDLQTEEMLSDDDDFA